MRKTILTIGSGLILLASLTACGTIASTESAAAPTAPTVEPTHTVEEEWVAQGHEPLAPTTIPAPVTAPPVVDKAALRAELLDAGKEWIGGQVMMLMTHNPKFEATLDSGTLVTVGDPRENAFKAWQAAAPLIDAALAAEKAAGSPDTDLIAVIDASFTQWDLAMADHSASPDELAAYGDAVTKQWQALGGKVI